MQIKTFLKKRFLIVFSLTLLYSCSTQLASLSREGEHAKDIAFDEMRIEIDDLKHALHSTQVELQILQEKLQKEESALSIVKRETPRKQGELQELLTSLERKCALLEKSQEKMLSDIRQLSNHANQTTATLIQYRDKIHECEKENALQNSRLDEIAKLKNTLQSISRAIQTKSSDEFSKYRIKAGDSLEKIAKAHHTSVEAIKQLNGLEKDKIVIGQEIKIPSGQHE